MGEVKNLVVTKQVRYFCDRCGNEISNPGAVLTSYPPIYVYICKCCNREVQLKKSYPYIEYEEIK